MPSATSPSYSLIDAFGLKALKMCVVNFARDCRTVLQLQDPKSQIVVSMFFSILPI